MEHPCITFAAILIGMLASFGLGVLYSSYGSAGKTPKVDQTIYDARPDQIPLSEAGLCVDCNVISASHNDCSACGSKSVLNISSILGGNLE